MASANTYPSGLSMSLLKFRNFTARLEAKNRMNLENMFPANSRRSVNITSDDCDQDCLVGIAAAGTCIGIIVSAVFFHVYISSFGKTNKYPNDPGSKICDFELRADYVCMPVDSESIKSISSADFIFRSLNPQLPYPIPSSVLDGEIPSTTAHNPPFPASSYVYISGSFKASSHSSINFPCQSVDMLSGAG
jgi:hypothetical protein